MESRIRSIGDSSNWSLRGRFGGALALRLLGLLDLLDLLGPRSPACVISTFVCLPVLAVNICFGTDTALAIAVIAAIGLAAAAGVRLT